MCVVSVYPFECVWRLLIGCPAGQRTRVIDGPRSRRCCSAAALPLPSPSSLAIRAANQSNRHPWEANVIVSALYKLTSLRYSRSSTDRRSDEASTSRTSQPERQSGAEARTEGADRWQQRRQQTPLPRRRRIVELFWRKKMTRRVCLRLFVLP